MNGKEKFLLRALIRWNKKDFVSKSCFSLKFVEQSAAANLNDGTSEYVIPSVKTDKCVIDALPSSLHTIQTSREFLVALRSIYRNQSSLQLRTQLVDNGFQIIKQLNSISKVLRNIYDEHIQHQDPIVVKKVKFRVGQVCEHTVHGYRGVVIGWTINEASGKQEILLLIDSGDFDEFLPRKSVLDSFISTEDQRRTRRLSLSEARLVADDDLLRITNEVLFSDYFIKFDLGLKRYVPRKELLFRFPLDFPRGSSSGTGQRRRGGGSVKLTKEQLDRQNSLKQVRQALLDQCADLLDIVRLYSLPQSLVDLSLADARAAVAMEISEVDRAAFPVVAEVILELKELEACLLAAGSLVVPTQVSSPQLQVWGQGRHLYSPERPVDGIASSVDDNSLSSSEVHVACKKLSALYGKIEQVMQCRLQQKSIGHIDDLLSVYRPERRHDRVAIDFLAKWLQSKTVADGQGDSSTPQVKVSKKRSVNKPNFEVHTAASAAAAASPSLDLTIVDSTVEPTVRFSVGQVVQHKRFQYRAVIFGYDQRPPLDVSEWSGVRDLVHKGNQPFYWVFPDEGDIESFLGPHQFRSNMYAAQENLELLAPSSSCPVKNRHLKHHFTGYDPRSGEFGLSSRLRFQFPRSADAQVVDESHNASASETSATSIPRAVNANSGKERESSDMLAQNLLLHLLGAMKLSFCASRNRSLPVHLLPDTFPRLRSITQYSIRNSDDLDPLQPVLSLASLMVLLRTAETSDEARNIECLIHDIHSAHNRSAVSKAMRLANLEISQKNPSGALQLLSKVALLDPSYGIAQTKMSALHHNGGKYKEAIYWAQQALRRDPSQYYAYRPLAVSQEQLGGERELDAEVSVRRGLQLYPWQSYMSTVLQSLRSKQYTKAVARLLKDAQGASSPPAESSSQDIGPTTEGVK